MQQLSLSARPKGLDQLLGQDKLVTAIRGLLATRKPKAWFFSGPKGTGKTTTARILALSYQCEHQKKLGNPCIECRKMSPKGISQGVWANFPIYEINCADVTGIDRMREMMAGADTGVMGIGAYRVYIIDEVHGLSNKAQDLLLKFLEDTPETTVFILCSSEPEGVSATVWSRAQCFEFRDLDLGDVEKLVVKLLARIGSELPADRLVEALSDLQVQSPRLIAQAVEKYAAGCAPEDAAKVSAVASVDIRALMRAIIRGNWEETARFLLDAQSGDMRSIRVALIGRLKRELLESPEISGRADALAKAITTIAEVRGTETSVIASSIAANCYLLCRTFQKFTLG